MADGSGKASVREHENEAGKDRIENLQNSVRWKRPVKNVILKS